MGNILDVNDRERKEPRDLIGKIKGRTMKLSDLKKEEKHLSDLKGKEKHLSSLIPIKKKLIRLPRC